MSTAAYETNELHSHAGDTTRLLKAMANEHRLLVLCALARGEMSVGQINDVVPLSQSSLSQHLGILRESGLVSTRRDAQVIFYRLKGDEAIRVIEVLQSAKALNVADASIDAPEDRNTSCSLLALNESTNDLWCVFNTICRLESTRFSFTRR